MSLVLVQGGPNKETMIMLLLLITLTEIGYQEQQLFSTAVLTHLLMQDRYRIFTGEGQVLWLIQITAIIKVSIQPPPLNQFHLDLANLIESIHLTHLVHHPLSSFGT